MHGGLTPSWRARAAWIAALMALLAGRGDAVLAAGGRYAASGHGSATTGVNRLPTLYSRGECGHCHGNRASAGSPPVEFPYVLFAQEEDVCWACHDGSVSLAADARVAFSSTPANTATDYYKHPVSSLFSGVTPSAHRNGESLASAFSGGSRHAECTDCHDPHSAANTGVAGTSVHTPGGSNGNRLSGALLGPTGLRVTSWQGAGQPLSAAAYSFGALTSTSANYEWQLCLKCHSTFAALPVYSAVGSGNFLANKLTSLTTGQVQEYQDLGQACNPNNLSFHPVAAPGRNTAIAAASFVAPWSATSTLYCSDCHGPAVGAAGALGPHGSANMHILKKPCYLQENTHYLDPTSGRSIGVGPDDLCCQCHRWETYVRGSDPSTNTGFRNGSDNFHSMHASQVRSVTCYVCHDTHGTNKEHLINFNRAVVTGSLSSQAAYTHTATGGSCNLTCHGEGHDPYSYSH